MAHAACRVGPNRYFDAYGFCSVADMQHRYRCQLREVPATESSVQHELGFDSVDLAQALRALEQVELAMAKAGEW